MTWSRPQDEEPHRESPVLEALAIELLGEGYAVDLVVTGSSMAPLLRSADVVTLTPIRGESVALGEVLAYTRGDGHLVIHRAVGTERDAVLMQGDSVRVADGWISRERILGRARRITRNGRRRRFGLGPERALVALLVRFGAVQRSIAILSFLRQVRERRIRKR